MKCFLENCIPFESLRTKMIEIQGLWILSLISAISKIIIEVYYYDFFISPDYVSLEISVRRSQFENAFGLGFFWFFNFCGLCTFVFCFFDWHIKS